MTGDEWGPVCGPSRAEMVEPPPRPAADAACGVGLDLETGGVGAAVMVAGCVAGSPVSPVAQHSGGRCPGRGGRC